jgi:hypothetical protein
MGSGERGVSAAPKGCHLRVSIRGALPAACFCLLLLLAAAACCCFVLFTRARFAAVPRKFAFVSVSEEQAMLSCLFGLGCFSEHVKQDDEKHSVSKRIICCAKASSPRLAS